MPTETPVLPNRTSDDKRIGTLVENARQGRCLLLRTGSARALTSAKVLKALLDPTMCTELTAEPETATGVDLAELPEDTLRWVEAGRLYEGLLRELTSGNRHRFVFCLDRWTACFLKPGRDICGDAKWVYVEEAESREHPDHEKQMEEWIALLPFDHRVSLASLEESTQALDSTTPAAVTDRAAWRCVFANPQEKLVAVLASSAEGIQLDFLASAELPDVRWVIQGAGLSSCSDKARRIHVLGDLPPPLRQRILEVADAHVVFSESALDSLEDTARERHLLVPARLEAKARAVFRQVAPFEDDSPNSFTNAVRQTFANSRPTQGKLAQITNFLLHNDWGIGDELLLSAVAREIVRARRDVRLWIRSRYGFRFPAYVEPGQAPGDATRVEVIYQNAALYGPQHHSPFPGHLVQQMLDKFALDTGIGVRAEDVRPEVILANTQTRRSRSVVIHSRPNPRLPSKDWGLERWMSLCEILHAANIQLLQVGAKEEPLLPHVGDYRGMPVGYVPDFIAQAGAVVCLVGFLMHAAAATRTPTAVIYGGREHPDIDGYPDQIHLSSDPMPCRGRWGCHLAADVTCPHGLRCMDGITPKSVAAQVLKLLESPKNGSES